MLLILDIDETLIYAANQPLDDQMYDFSFAGYFVYKRPFLAEFLEFCAQHFELALWTSSTEGYAKVIADQLFQPEQLRFVWARKRCTVLFNGYDYSYVWLKNLRKVKNQGYKLQQVLVVDDSPEKHTKNYGNLIVVKPFFGDQQDQELRLLMSYLVKLKECPNVRKVEKRFWRQQL